MSLNRARHSQTPRLGLLLLVLLSLANVGCVRSIEPLYSTDLSDLTMEPSLAGTWESSDGKLLAVFEPKGLEDKAGNEELKGYILHLTQRRDGEKKADLHGTFGVGVVKVGDRVYADVVPVAFPNKDDSAPENWWMLMQATHVFLWLEKVDADQLVIQQPDEEKWVAAVRAYQTTPEGKGLIAKIDDKSLLFYAPPAELKKFVLSLDKNPEAFKKMDPFRKISAATQPADATTKQATTQPAVP